MLYNLVMSVIIILIQIHTHMQTQADTVVQVRTVLLTPDFSSSTQRERHNSYYANPIPTHGASCDV